MGWQKAIPDVVSGHHRAQASGGRTEKKDYAVDSSISGILLLDLDGVVLYANRAYLDLWAYRNAEKAIGHTLTEIAADKELAKRLLTTVQTEGEWKGELHAIRRDSTTIDVLLSASFVRDEKGIPIAIMA